MKKIILFFSFFIFFSLNSNKVFGMSLSGSGNVNFGGKSAVFYVTWSMGMTNCVMGYDGYDRNGIYKTTPNGWSPGWGVVGSCSGASYPVTVYCKPGQTSYSDWFRVGTDIWYSKDYQDYYLTNCSTITTNNVTISPTTVIPDGSAYTITITSTNNAGAGGGNGISNQAVIIDYQNMDSTPQAAANNRGLIAWSNDNFSMWGSAIDQKTFCSDASGYIARYSPSSGQNYGRDNINVLDCTSSVATNVRTTILKVSFNSSFTTPASNVLSGWTKTSLGAIDDWIPKNTFALGAAPIIVGISTADVGTGNAASPMNFGSGTVSSKGWKAKTDASGLGAKYGYGYWSNFLLSRTIPLPNPTFVGANNLNSLTNTYYFYDGPVTITDAQEITTANKVLVFLIHGDLNINNRILRRDKSTFLAFFVSGNIVVDGAVVGIDGIFSADGNIIFNTGSSQLLANGIFFTKNGVISSRSLSTNSTTPAVIFQFDPSLVLNAPPELMKPKYSWQEIAP